MQLIVVHQVLIGMAIGLGGIFALRSLWMFNRTRSPLDLAVTAAAIITCILLTRYLKTVRDKWRAQKRDQRRE